MDEEKARRRSRRQSDPSVRSNRSSPSLLSGPSTSQSRMQSRYQSEVEWKPPVYKGASCDEARPRSAKKPYFGHASCISTVAEVLGTEKDYWFSGQPVQRTEPQDMDVAGLSTGKLTQMKAGRLGKDGRAHANDNRHRPTDPITHTKDEDVGEKVRSPAPPGSPAGQPSARLTTLAAHHHKGASPTLKGFQPPPRDQPVTAHSTETAPRDVTRIMASRGLRRDGNRTHSNVPLEHNDKYPCVPQTREEMKAKGMQKSSRAPGTGEALTLIFGEGDTLPAATQTLLTSDIKKKNSPHLFVPRGYQETDSRSPLLDTFKITQKH